MALGQWCSDVPSSNVAAESVYGSMRPIDSDQRSSLKEEGLTEELKGKVMAGYLILSYCLFIEMCVSKALHIPER